ncbi:asparaginase [Sinosporangium siamense]|uniref:Asparaginase n=1 Tax=Sinosporangium siamense TaxID=1367973 RepID=A0A919V7R1_9ACTN|nr:asparaginase [Sinosporangium siamense]GII93376.1 asparaginase [Sinosporangium siamense]
MSSESLIVEVVRSGFVESTHRARMLTLDADGKPVCIYGAVDKLVSPRSSMKPFQAVGMLRAGLPLDGEQLALAASSHMGETQQTEAIRKILASVDLDERALRCPESLPDHRETAREVLRSGGEPSPIYMNCSGKHAAMVVTCAVNGWPTETYLDPAHPLQRVIRDTVEELTGERIAASGVDGCGAPLFFVSMAGVTRAFRALPLAAPGTPERRLADAMRAHPDWVTGAELPETTLMRTFPGLLVKAGAEGFDAFSYADGRAGAIKIEDGGSRARPAVTAAALRSVGLDAPELAKLDSVPLFGGGKPVGEIRLRRVH